MYYKYVYRIILCKFTKFKYNFTNLEKSDKMSMTDVENEQIKTMKDFMANYNKLSEVCFADCIWDFTSRKISGVENQCALYCTEKYLKMNQRISTRFQEFQMISNENAMAVIKKSGQL